MRTRFKCSILAGACLVAVAATPAMADQAGTPKSAAAPDSGEIVVTASKTEQVVSKVPVSIAAYTQAQLDKQSVRSFADIAALTPGITFQPGSNGNGTSTTVSIRGISSGAGTATVGVYIDDTPVQVRSSGYYDSTNPYPRIFDLDRVEVLRGPQGTLFGAGSEGGTIRFITPEPSLDKTSVYARSELAGTKSGASSYETGVALGMPLVEGVLGMRVSAYYRHDGGYVDKVDWYDKSDKGQDVNWSDTLVLRGALKYEPSDAVTITPAIFYQRVYQNDSSTVWQSYSNPSDTQFVNANPLRTPSKDAYWMPSLKIDARIGAGLSLISSTSYFSRVLDNTYDSSTLDISSFTSLFGNPVNTDPPPAALRDFYSAGYVTSKQTIFTQEARLQNDPHARFNFVLGGYFQSAIQNNSYDVWDPNIDTVLSYAAGAPVTVQGIFGIPLYQNQYLLASQDHVVDREVAVFGQANFKLTDALTVFAGLRYSHVTYADSNFGAGPVLSSTGTVTSSGQSANPVTPKFGATWQATPSTMVYATVAKGFRPGNTASQVASICDSDLTALGLNAAAHPIEPDTVWSYEAGVKTKLFGNRVYFDGSVYRVDWHNIQSTITLPTCNRSIEANLGDARSQGVELQMNVKVTGRLTLGGSLGYSDAHYTTATMGAGGALIRAAGDPLPIPPWQLALSGEYQFPIMGKQGYVRTDYQFASHDGTPLNLAEAGIDPTLPRTPAQNNLDFRAGVRFTGLDLSAFVTNALNQHPRLGLYRDTLDTTNYRYVTVRPLTAGVTASFRY
jgi:iron complex outermembrane recepter protein